MGCEGQWVVVMHDSIVFQEQLKRVFLKHRWEGFTVVFGTCFAHRKVCVFFSFMFQLPIAVFMPGRCFCRILKWAFCRRYFHNLFPTYTHTNMGIIRGCCAVHMLFYNACTSKCMYVKGLPFAVEKQIISRNLYCSAVGVCASVSVYSYLLWTKLKMPLSCFLYSSRLVLDM